MLLGVSQRIQLLSLLPPAEGDAYFLRAVRRLRTSLSLSDEETALWHVEYHESGRVTWNPAAGRIEIDLSGKTGSYVSLCLKKLNDVGRLPEDLLDIYDFFFPEVE